MENTRARLHGNGLLNPRETGRHVPDDISRTRLKSSFPFAHLRSFPNSPFNSPGWPPGSLRSLSHLRRLFCTVHVFSLSHWLVWLRHHHLFQAPATQFSSSNSDSLKNTFGRSRPKRISPRKSAADSFMYSSSVQHFEHHLPLKLQTFRAPKPCSIHLRSCG